MKSYECLATTDNLRNIISMIAEGMIASQTTTAIRQKLFVVLEELYNNVALHAYKHTDQCGLIKVSLLADQEAVQLRVEDQGIPFNLLEFDDAKRVKNLKSLPEEEGGIFLVKSFSSQIEYAYINGWNRVDILLEMQPNSLAP